MAKFFSDSPNRAARALQIWLILIGKASNRQTVTYEMLNGMLGFKGHGGVLGPILDYLMRYCRQESLPPLTVLVVNKHTGLPGPGLTETDLNADRETVFNYDWFAIAPPTLDELRAAQQAHVVAPTA